MRRSCPRPRLRPGSCRTRTANPSGLLLLTGVSGHSPVAAIAGVRSFVLDELGQPSDLPVDGLEPMFVQRPGVTVEPLAGARQHAAHPFALLLHPPPATLEDLQPDVRAGLGEERQPRTEAVVVEGIRADRGEQLGKMFLTLSGELVYPLAAPGPHRRGGVERRLLGDPPCLGEPAQGGIERTVGKCAECPEQRGEPFTKLVSVHWALAEQPEDGDLQQCDGPLSRCDVSARYMSAMSRCQFGVRQVTGNPGGRRRSALLTCRKGA